MIDYFFCNSVFLAISNETTIALNTKKVGVQICCSDLLLNTKFTGARTSTDDGRGPSYGVSPMKYNSKKEAEILEKDKILIKYPLNIKPKNVEIIPLEQVFE